MCAGTTRRIISIWLPRLPSERWGATEDQPFALSLARGNREVVYCLTPAAEKLGVKIGMAVSEAHTIAKGLEVKPANPAADARFLEGLRRWAQLYTPWAVRDGEDGLLLDITGAAHLQGGEEELVALLDARLQKSGLTPRIGLANTRGAAWALAHFAPSIAHETLAALAPLPVAALRLAPEVNVGLQRLGLRSIGALQAAARAPLTRRFGPELLLRLDQALGAISEPLSPEREKPVFHAELRFAEPIGLLADLTEALKRLLSTLCAQLLAELHGARVLELRLHRTDKGMLPLPLRLAAPMREAARILPLFARSLESVDAGFGIERIELSAPRAEALPIEQLGAQTMRPLDDLLTRIGSRIGLENIHHYEALESHWPERSFTRHFAPFSLQKWPQERRRPLVIFPPESITAQGAEPPQSFRWRAMRLTTAHAAGPERIAPEWWQEDELLRDYWRIHTHQGRRLWLFYTPQRPNWYVQGEFA